jgi:hypothetical protein
MYAVRQIKKKISLMLLGMILLKYGNGTRAQ